MKKVLIIPVLLAVLCSAFIIQPTQGKNMPYYSGKAVSYNGTFYVGTTNTGDFELFALSNGQLNKVTDIQSNDQESHAFCDVLFQKADGNLYAYLTNGRYLYKYDISNPLAPVVLMKIKDNSWDWFSRIEMVNGKLVTIGSKGTKIWNSDMQVIDVYSAITSKAVGDSQFVDDGNVIATIKDKLDFYSVATQQKVSEYTIATADPNGPKAIASDDNLVYLVDDQSLKAVDLDGNVVGQFDHAGSAGYDVINSTNSDYVYFSDGLGVVKIKKSDMKSIVWNWTVNNSPAGSWAMGLSSANDANGEKIAVFNGTEIMVLDSNMKKIAEYMSVQQDTRPSESLSLTVDKNLGAAGSQVQVSGTGFAVNETINVQIDKIQVGQVQSDSYGRFTTIVVVPAVVGPLSADVKVTGASSNLTYSTSFRIE